MSSPVQLYVYDLSNGMAKQLSRQLTGRQIDGVWLVRYKTSHFRSILMTIYSKAYLCCSFWQRGLLWARN